MESKEVYSELYSLLSKELQLLPDKPDETIESTIRELWCFSCSEDINCSNNCSQKCFRNGNAELPLLDSDKIQKLNALVRKRLEGIPLAYLVRRARFLNLDLEICPGAMIPRKETEILVLHSLDLIKQMAKKQNRIKVVDTCTGSGNVALALAHNEKKAVVCANDISPEAIEIARRNAVRLKLSDRVTFSTGDLLAPYLNDGMVGNTDMITCNPPYISDMTRKQMPKEIIEHEPDLAFNGGVFGITILNRVITEGQLLLRSGGWLCMEIGAGQGNGIKTKMSRSEKWDEIHEIYDSMGVVRVILAKKK